MTPKATKANTDNWYIKLKSFCAAKETINRIERQPAEMGENIYQSYTWGKRLISKTYRKSSNSIAEN